jgi:hypothetical protein
MHGCAGDVGGTNARTIFNRKAVPNFNIQYVEESAREKQSKLGTARLRRTAAAAAAQTSKQWCVVVNSAVLSSGCW